MPGTVVETVARTMAEAGASSLKQAIGNCKDPAAAKELAVTMPEARADSGASGAYIVKVSYVYKSQLSIFPNLLHGNPCKVTII